MTHSQPSKSNLTMASEYALIAGSGAAAIASVVTQQATMATLSPIAALVALGMINRHRLDQQLQNSQSAGQPLDTKAAQGESSVPPRMLASLRPEPVSPRPQMVETRIPSVAFSRPQPYIAGPLAVKQQAQQAQTDLEAHLSAKLRQIGEDLRQQRQAKGWSVDQIYQMTFIQPYVLHAIESGNLHQLPEPFYIRAFLQKYALALGLDGGVIAQRFATVSGFT
jgi:Helix-turn-helix domain